MNTLLFPKNADRQEMNHQKPSLGRRELWKKQGVAEPGLAGAYKPHGDPGCLVPTAQCSLASTCCGACPNLADAPAQCAAMAALLAAVRCCVLRWLCCAWASSAQSFCAAAKSRRAELLHRAAVWFNRSRWEGMVTASPRPTKAPGDCVCEEARGESRAVPLARVRPGWKSLPCQPVRGSAARAGA